MVSSCYCWKTASHSVDHESFAFSFRFTFRIILCLLCIPDVVDGGKAEEYGQKVSFFFLSSSLINM